jgi:hypothetical protein
MNCFWKSLLIKNKLCQKCLFSFLMNWQDSITVPSIQFTTKQQRCISFRHKLTNCNGWPLRYKMNTDKHFINFTNIHNFDITVITSFSPCTFCSLSSQSYKSWIKLKCTFFLVPCNSESSSCHHSNKQFPCLATVFTDDLSIDLLLCTLNHVTLPNGNLILAKGKIAVLIAAWQLTSTFLRTEWGHQNKPCTFIHKIVSLTVWSSLWNICLLRVCAACEWWS